MRIFYFLTFLTIILCTELASGQHVQRCHATEIHDETYVQDADYRHWYDTRMVELDAIRTSTVNNAERFDCINPILIPVAVHYEGVTNQSMSCLTNLALAQLEVMNEAFSASNPDISAFNAVVDQTEMTIDQLAQEGACIEFCLADADHPAGFGLNDGDYAITINEDYVANNNFPNFTNGIWAGYLNIFVTEGTGVLGYSPLYGNANGSGIVIEACVFGTTSTACGNGIGPDGNCLFSQYNTGRTSVHEAGHYLGLNHLWGPGNQGTGSCSTDDGLPDTPNSESENFGCPIIGSSSCGSADMFMNYMDYANDECMYMFSEMQAQLMYNSASSIWNTQSVKCSSSITINDASIANIVFPANNSCGSSVAPIVLLRNAGANTLTNVEINYSAGAAGSNTFNWTGSLQQNEFETLTLPSIAIPSTNYTLVVSTANPNGMADENPTNDSKSEPLAVLEGVGLPFTEDVEDFSQPFPAQGIIIDNIDNDNFTWDRRPGASAYGNGVYSIYFNNFDATSGVGNEDWFILPETDASGFNSVNLSFDLAYAYFSSGTDIREDQLKIMYSLGCTDTWQEAWLDGGTSLATTSPSASFYLPNAQNDWVNKTIGINTDGFDFIRIAFVNISGNGNNLYMDNINIQGSTAIVSNNEIESLSKFDISPNPSQGYLNVNVEFKQHKEFEILIHDIMGRQLYFRKQTAAISNEQLDLNEFANGVYMISIRSGNQIITEKFILNK